MRSPVAAALGVAFACYTSVTCNAASIKELKAAIDGIYILDEWYSDGQTFRPPTIEGRFVLLNGSVVTVLINIKEDTKKTYSTLIGIYLLTPTSFAYRYETRATFTQTSEGIALNRTIPWEGMREFTVQQDGSSVHLQYGNKAAFDFSPVGMTYSESGKALRVYHRAKPE